MAERFGIAVHGGAGDETEPKTPDERERFLNGLRRALQAGLDILAGGGSSLDAVELAVRCLEDDPLFNAGKGSIYTIDGTHRMDAGIMRGADLACGAVAGVTSVKNPVALARRVLEKSPYILLTAEDAEALAREQGLEIVDKRYFDDSLRLEQWRQSLGKPGSSDTVGAVALDKGGHLAASGSTGGLKNMPNGRLSDTASIGAGLYADDRTAAIACSGTGEAFIRQVVAHDIHALVMYRGLALSEAIEEVVGGKLQPGDGGVIGIDPHGEITIRFNTPTMFRGAADDRGRFTVEI